MNAEQQANFAALASTVAEIMLEARASKMQNLDEVESLLQEPSFNQARALEMVQQKTQTINEKAPLVVASLAVFLDSLSAEQKTELQDFIEHVRSHRGHGHHHHHRMQHDK